MQLSASFPHFYLAAIYCAVDPFSPRDFSYSEGALVPSSRRAAGSGVKRVFLAWLPRAGIHLLSFLVFSAVGSSFLALVRSLILDLVSWRRNDFAWLRIVYALSCALRIGSAGLGHSNFPLLSSGLWCRSNSTIAASCFWVKHSATSFSCICIWAHRWFHSCSKAMRFLSEPQPISKEQDEDPSDDSAFASCASIWLLLDVIASCSVLRLFVS